MIASVRTSFLLGSQQVSQLSDGAGDLRRGSAAETQNEARALRFACVGGRKRPEPKVLTGGALYNFQIAPPVLQSHGQMHASLVSHHLDHGPEFLLDAVRQRGPALAVENSHPSNVAPKMSLIDKFREDFLKEGWRSQIQSAANSRKTVDQVRWNNDISQAQRRK